LWKKMHRYCIISVYIAYYVLRFAYLPNMNITSIFSIITQMYSKLYFVWLLFSTFSSSIVYFFMIFFSCFVSKKKPVKNLFPFSWINSIIYLSYLDILYALQWISTGFVSKLLDVMGTGLSSVVLSPFNLQLFMKSC